MAGSDNFAPVVMPGSVEIPPSMVVETSSGMSGRLTLDHSSFEKLLAAAWVLQCLHDQLHDQEGILDESIADVAKSSEPPQAANPGSPAAVQMVVQPSPEVNCAERVLDVLSGRPADHKILAQLVVQQPVETRTLSIDDPVKVEPETFGPAVSPHSENVVVWRPSKPPLPEVEKVASDDEKQRARPRPAFNVYTVKLRAALRRTLDAITSLRPVYRVNLPLRAVRAVAIATPVLVLTLVAASLLFETWRRESLNSAQAISSPDAAAEAVDTSKTLTTRSRAASRDHKRITNKTSNPPDAIPPLRSSHRQVTDPATSSAVQELSRYEIKGLRRQAKYGDASAAFTLGMAYEVGRHVPQNCAEAARWVTTAAEAGDAAAEYNLGLRYRDGDGVPGNRAESEKWLRRAAARKYPKANLALKMLASR